MRVESRLMQVPLRTHHFEIESSFVPDFKGFSLEKLWSHPELKAFKAKKGREIFILQLAGKSFFVKRYYGPASGFLSYIVRGFRDKYGPENEWQKAVFLKRAGIRAVEPVAFGIERRCGIIKRALTVSLKMEGDRLEDLLRSKMNLEEKSSVVEKLAAFAGRFHALGLSHQDFYLCHLFWNTVTREVALIDLQRIRFHGGSSRQPRLGWIVKDLAQLDYSASNVLSGEEYKELKKIFVTVYADYVPVITEPRVVDKIQGKVARIARHDQNLKAKI
ncbi:MAG: lipopolysaccharide kinase InaA family protein [Syntrophobacteria bacterium]